MSYWEEQDDDLAEFFLDDCFDVEVGYYLFTIGLFSYPVCCFSYVEFD